MRGMELLEELSTATGLPNELIGEELSRLVCSAERSIESVTLEDLREMLASYLQDILLDAKDSFAEKNHGELQAVAASMHSAADPAVDSGTVVSLSRHLRTADVVSVDSSTPTFAMFGPLGNTAADFIGES